MTHSTMQNKKKLQTVLAVVFWLAVWQIAAMAMQQEFLLASPLRVLQRLWVLMGTAAFWQAVGASIVRIVLGFMCAAVLGIGLAALTAKQRWAKILLAPLLSAVKRALPSS